MPEEETRDRSGARGPDYERPAKIESKYDPQNLCRHNPNITPAPSGNPALMKQYADRKDIHERMKGRAGTYSGGKLEINRMV